MTDEVAGVEITDWKMMDKIAGVETAGLENGGLENDGQENDGLEFGGLWWI